MIKQGWIAHAVGEISKLRNNLFSNLDWRVTGGNYGTPYKLNSSRVNYAKARMLYRNTDDDYKLGAGFSKSIINTTAAFMGVPTFRSEDEDAQDTLKSFFDANISRMQQVHRNTLRDGDIFVWVTREETENDKLYPEEDTRLVFNIIPPEQVKKINRDPLTGKPKEYILVSEHVWEDQGGKQCRATITQRINKESRVILAEGDVPPDLKLGEEPNIWGFIPIVHFKNEGDEQEEFGTSDLEAIEPFMKAYHDVSMHAIQGSKMHSTPKLKLKLKDVGEFLKNNFGIEDAVEYARKGGTINLDGKEMILLNAKDDENAEFIEARSATGDAKDLLQLLFYCIVDTSEMPEFVFGVHTPSSLSSVKEQMPILVRRISRKREQFADGWKLLARIVLAMTAQSQGKRFTTHATTLSWEQVNPKDDKEMSETILNIVNALDKALVGEFISIEAAVDFLKQYIDTMYGYSPSEDGKTPGEGKRIMETRLMRMRLEDGQFLDEQRKEIDRALEI